jgi:hypothetical protein
MCFEVESSPDGLVMNPYMFQMANPPVYQEVSDDAQGVALARELREFAAMWDKNLSDQGFLEAARRLRPSAAIQSGESHDQSR